MPRKIDQFRHKRCQKKLKDVEHELLFEFIQKYFVVHELWDVKDALSTYVCTEGIYSCGVNCTLCAKGTNPCAHVLNRLGTLNPINWHLFDVIETEGC